MSNYPDYNNTEYSHYEKFHDSREHNVVEAIKTYGESNPNAHNTPDEEVQKNELINAINEIKSAITAINTSLSTLGSSKSPLLSTLSGYDATKTQTLKNDSGTLKWVDDVVGGGE